MRKFALTLSACVVFLFTAFAPAQETHIAVGASTLFSSKSLSASQLYIPPPEKGGIYPSFSIDRLVEGHFGVSAEIAGLYKRALYNGVQEYRPYLYDFNGVFSPAPITKKTHMDFLAGVGGQRVLFYGQNGNCSSPIGCATLFNTNRFLFHLGADVRYNLWNHFFFRPEAHYYYIIHNSTQFHSDNVLRLGASFGYTFGQ